MSSSAIMPRASLGHNGRPRLAGPKTVMIYSLVNLGAMLRVFGPTTDLSTTLIFGLSAMAWNGAYLLFARIYGRFLLGPNLDTVWVLSFAIPSPTRVRNGRGLTGSIVLVIRRFGGLVCWCFCGRPISMTGEEFFFHFFRPIPKRRVGRFLPRLFSETPNADFLIDFCL
jgi:hypothetical protein